jgi:hypothetical protein
MTTNAEPPQESPSQSSAMHGIFNILPNANSPPHVQFYRHPKINWKFSLGHTYKLIRHPESDLEWGVYRFSSNPGNIASQTIYSKAFEYTGGLSKNVYKQYTVVVTFLGMARKQVIDYCYKHKVSEEFISILKGSENLL